MNESLAMPGPGRDRSNTMPMMERHVLKRRQGALMNHGNGGHGHAGHMPSSGSGMAISAWLTGIYFFIEMAIGLWTGSVAVISDAFHTFSAVGGVLVAIIAARLARRPADEDRSFGWYRAEIVGALVNGGFLLGMALIVIVMAGMRMTDPIDLPTAPLLWAAAGGLLTEIISLGLIWKQSRSDLNVKGALWHIIQTFVGSLLIIVTALVIRFTGFLLIDPLLGMVFGFVLLWASWGILRDATHLLMEGTPAEIRLAEVTAALVALDGVEDAHHVHAWALTSGRYVFSGHLRISDGADPQAVLKAAYRMLKDQYGFFFATLQVETACLDESGAEAIDVTHVASKGGRA
ncbi:cation diffusion facilitator family transporter [Halomonas sp. 1390]|uniref:cation diffusion facilitator family transporter n=1 Tax=Halomonas sp. B23F22_3 TaxID=3459516 RepID=UPI00373F46E8